MRVRLFANLAEEAGEREIVLSVPADATVVDVLDELCGRHPGLRPLILDDDDAIHGHVNVLLDGSNVENLEDGLRAPVGADAEELAIFPPVSGGSRRANLRRRRDRASR